MPNDPLTRFQYQFSPGEPGGSPVALLLLHGTGGDENDLLSLGSLLAPGAALLSPRGRVLENGMPRFFGRFAEGVFDVEDIKVRAAELGEFVRAARDRHSIGDRPLYAVGFSNGGNMGAALLLLDPELLQGAILFRAMVPLTSETPPNLQGKTVFLGAGRSDPLVRPYESERLAETLRGSGADVALFWTNTGHALSQEDVDAARDWIAERKL
jgi:phospholipase/carboxylesterase